ncbi:RcnB family protein [Sphingomonas sp. AP4-R1]|uniref:RcnB family protein n=1 Tax=Sphingomonas sp. AP4-R1 TaxID=2735134 RepID=UPI001493A89D|nr:RcnB family protein [Sphingomonas sp. AP4-R1]QJU56665.1 RcnB family protein [Sphingomonas sp. AP4-R1]
MRKLIIAGLMAATLVPTIASAQNRELRHDRQDIREEQRDVNRAIRNGAPPHVVRDQQRDVREARREYREDWRDYRRGNPNVFRGPAYVGPRGYAYRPIAPGYRFDRLYYDRRYWIDPVRYRLPAAAYGRRWVRYGNDVVLVDVRTGRVVTVYNSFFF